MTDIEAVNNQINNFVNEIHRLREPITPTKEQIEYIGNKVILNPRKYAYKIRGIIREWEKIRGGEKC